MVVDVRKVLQAMRTKTAAIAAQVKAKPALEPIVLSFRISGSLPEREPMRIPEFAERYCHFAKKRRGDRYKDSRHGQGRCTTHIFF